MKFTFPPESQPLDGYTIKRGIHRGGFGEVYYALSDAGKEVALKLLQHNREVELRGVQQCLNLKHPNLITIFDIKRDKDGDHWIVMEYVSGKSLDRVLAEHPHGLAIEDVFRWLAGIVAGLSYLHDRGIVHRDLKPANVYQEHGQVKLGDVGLSKFISESRRSAQTQSVGTVYYMAPEVAKGRYGREVDVYGLGVMLYEMLTGRVPFDGETAGEILMKHLSEQPDLAPIPPRLRPVLQRALEKDPLKRTPSAAQLEAEFRRAVTGREASADRPVETFSPGSAAAGVSGARSGGRHRSACGSSSLTGPNILPVLVVAGVIWLLTGGGWLGSVAPSWVALLLMGGALAAVGFGVKCFSKLAAGAVAPPVPTHAVAETQPYHRPYQSSPAPPPITPSVHRSAAQAVPVRQYHPQGLTPATLRRISPRERAMQLTGSMSFAVAVTVAITLGLVLLGFLTDAAAVGLFGLITLLASWVLLAAAKVWEGTGIQPMARRTALLGLGAVVGLAAGWTSEFLLVDWTGQTNNDALVSTVGARPLSADGRPTAAAFAVFFAGLFALRQWWQQADAFRLRQYRVGAALLTLLLGYLLTTVFQFPHAWGMLWALAISSVVQLSAVWVPPDRRTASLEARHDAV